MKPILKNAAISLAAILLSQTAANAHAHLLSTKLIANAAGQIEADLNFSEILALQFSSAKIVAVEGQQIDLGNL